MSVPFLDQPGGNSLKKTGVGHNMGHFEAIFFYLKIKSLITAN